MSLKQRSRLPFALALSLGALCFSAANHASASSCCAGSGGQSICVLPSEQRFQLGLSTTYRIIEGEFDPYGSYTANAQGYSSQQLTTVIGGAYRLSEDLQSGVSVPVVTSRQTIAGNARAATSLGDPAVELRYLLWEDLAFLRYRPQLALYGGLRAPLGKPVDDTLDAYALDAVGDGAFTAHAGFNASKLYRPVRFTLDGAYFYPFSRTVDRMRGAPIPSPYQLRGGDRFQLLESLTYLVDQRWSGTVGARQLWVLQSSLNGASMDGSAQRLFSTLASLNYFDDSAWALALNYETAFPFYRYLANQPNAQSVALALTYGGF